MSIEERCDRSRQQIESAAGDAMTAPDISPESRQLRMLDCMLEVLLDIRETLYRMERDKSNKWGSKL